MTHCQGEDLAFAGGSYFGADHQSAGDDLVAVAVTGVRVGRVQEGEGELDMGRARFTNTLTCTSRFLQMLDFSDLEIPDSTSNARTRSSILRVEVPVTNASITTAHGPD